ncbi:MAG: hypothetical protein IPJ61_18705 [Tessaracoccus sp.]|uniref:hypothetical protein n=1 Tax=Tessaracoccus sp. TaxID=1971211 RepID=UPI001EB8EFBF|nr:hypothetical protein [Tessaracoccus sp.]MBK7823016.1 hypothetical protein [Tessaracoccus sp.]
MQTAQTLPRSVGVAPGTTTLVLSGPTVGCENPARVARQRQMLYPPGKVNVGLPPAPAGWQAGPAATMATATTAARPPRAGGTQAVEAVRNAVTRVQNVLDPYGTIESLKGVIASRETRLGLVLAPEGDRSPYPSSEIVAVGKTTAGPSAYCTRRPERGPNFRENQTWQYEHEGLGAVPTDLQLATQRGYTPVFSQWAPGKTGAYSPLPWIPPTGSPRSTLPGDPPGYVQGYMTQLAGPRMTMLGADGEPTVTSPLAPTTAPPAEYNAGQAAVEELKRHQDRMYSLGILSAAAVAMTAMVNVFRYMDDKRTARKRTKTAVAAEPAPALSGRRLRRR